MKNIISRDNCPVCESSTSEPVLNMKFNDPLMKRYMDIVYQGNADTNFLEDVNFEIVKCNDCHLPYQKYVLDDEKLNDLYNKWIDPFLALKWNEEGDKPKYKQVYTNILLNAAKFLKKQPSKTKVLDFGAGFGDAILTAKELGFDAYAYEYSIERKNFLRNKGVKIIEEDDIKFDFIMIHQVLEHLTCPKTLLQDVHSRLVKNGLVYVAVPNCTLFIEQIRGVDKIKNVEELNKKFQIANISPFQHINFFNNTNFKILLRRNNLRPLHPLKQSIYNWSSLKSIIRPFYRHYFTTGLFAEKI